MKDSGSESALCNERKMEEKINILPCAKWRATIRDKNEAHWSNDKNGWFHSSIRVALVVDIGLSRTPFDLFKSTTSNIELKFTQWILASCAVIFILFRRMGAWVFVDLLPSLSPSLFCVGSDMLSGSRGRSRQQPKNKKEKKEKKRNVSKKRCESYEMLVYSYLLSQWEFSSCTFISRVHDC